MSNYKVEQVWEIWGENDYHIEVGLDRDDLDLAEIREYEGDAIIDRMTFDNEALDKLIECLVKFREWKVERNNDKKVSKETNSS